LPEFATSDPLPVSVSAPLPSRVSVVLKKYCGFRILIVPPEAPIVNAWVLVIWAVVVSVPPLRVTGAWPTVVEPRLSLVLMETVPLLIVVVP
jgi:hypothetical protein